MMAAQAMAEPFERGDDHFDEFGDAVRRKIASAAKRPLFTTDATGLWDAYLAAFDADERQTHNCHACRHFVERHGGLVTVNDDGTTEPLCWPADVPAVYAPSVESMLRIVHGARVTGVYLSSAPRWGTGPTWSEKHGVEWRHQECESPNVYRGALLNAGQAVAEKREERGMLVTALAEFDEPTVRTAKALLETSALYRSEKVLGVAKWLHALQLRLDAEKHEQRRANLLWLAVATAAPGWCHVRSTMIGTLLEDLAAGVPHDDAARKFAAKMHPLQYQRPQELPTESGLAEAERLVEKLGVGASLARRFARLEDLQTLWTPAATPSKPKAGGVFSAVKTRGPKAEPVTLAVPPIVMTWDKFARVVLPTAERIEYAVPSGRAGFYAFVTAADASAPPIVQWDSEDKRNPVTWYVHSGGSYAASFNLRSGSWCQVNAVTLFPQMWSGGKFEHQAAGVLFVLDGCRDVEGGAHGGALFPEHLRSELRSIRRAIEAHSNQTPIEGRDEASACGIAIRAGGSELVQLRVMAGGSVAAYTLDRWD